MPHALTQQSGVWTDCLVFRKSQAGIVWMKGVLKSLLGKGDSVATSLRQRAFAS